MTDNKITPSSIKKCMRKLQKKRRVRQDSLQTLADMAFITTGFLAVTANDLSSKGGSSFLRNNDLRCVFEAFGMEKIFDETYERFLAEVINPEKK